jgi:Restriction endonuclease.
MTVFGVSDGWENLLQNLDQNKLLDLLTDILTSEGHRDIKITDGTGDGKRDVHSIDSHGNKFLSQSKFHGGIHKTVSSTEISELPIGMVKKGYTFGIFVTNAKISPQAKSEFLDDYPGLNLRYFDGLELVKTIHENIILKAVWINGDSVDQVNYLLNIPMIVRDLEKDKPLIPSTNFFNNQYCIGRSSFELQLIQSVTNTTPFRGYRPPKIKTITEMNLTQIVASDILVKGSLHVQDFEKIIHFISLEIAQYCSVIYKNKPHQAIIFGEPFLLPLSGDMSGVQLPLKLPSFTLVIHNGEIESEDKWLIPDETSEWKFPRDPRASVADWIRWYNKEIDACLNLKVISPPSNDARCKIEDDYRYFIKWWKHSLFFWIPNEKIFFWERAGIDPPTYYYKMDNERTICVWLHPNLTNFHFRSITESDSDAETTQVVMGFGDLIQETAELKNKIEHEGGVLIEPEKARHIIGYLVADPYPIKDEVVYRSIDVMLNTPDIPTPILPNSRQIEFSIIWAINGIIIKNWEDFPLLSRKLVELFGEKQLPFTLSYNFDEDCLFHKSYIQINLNYSLPLGQENTTTILQNLDENLRIAIKEIEEQLSVFFLMKRATYSYWTMEIGVLF